MISAIISSITKVANIFRGDCTSLMGSDGPSLYQTMFSLFALHICDCSVLHSVPSPPMRVSEVFPSSLGCLSPKSSPSSLSLTSSLSSINSTTSSVSNRHCLSVLHLYRYGFIDKLDASSALNAIEPFVGM